MLLVCRGIGVDLSGGALRPAQRRSWTDANNDSLHAQRWRPLGGERMLRVEYHIASGTLPSALIGGHADGGA